MTITHDVEPRRAKVRNRLCYSHVLKGVPFLSQKPFNQVRRALLKISLLVGHQLQRDLHGVFHSQELVGMRYTCSDLFDTPSYFRAVLCNDSSLGVVTWTILRAVMTMQRDCL